MGLASFERRLERLVEGAFARAFRSGLQPVEVGRRLTREMDLRRTVAPKGTLAPNHFDVVLSPSDRERFLPIEDELIAELISVARDHARSEGYVFVGPVSITLDSDDHLSTGTMEVRGTMERPQGGRRDRAASTVPAPDPAPPAAEFPRPRRSPPPPEPVAAPASAPQPVYAGGQGVLVLPDGREVQVDERPVIIGRMPGCEIVLADPNVSRRHAEVRDEGGRWMVRDLGSTNGTKVNGVRLSAPQELGPGDEIRVGATGIRFEVD
jgi:hypothetical protein